MVKFSCKVGRDDDETGYAFTAPSVLGRASSVLSPQHFEAVEDEPTGTCQPDISGDKISIIEDVEQSSINPSGPVGGVVQYVHLPDNLLTEEYVKIVVKTDSSTSSSIGHNTRVGDHKVALLSGATGDASNVYGSIADASGVEGGDIAKAGVSQYLHGGVFGENGLLSISHVPMLLVIAAIHSVRYRHVKNAKRAFELCCTLER